MDETRHPNPLEFRPEMYEGENQTVTNSVANPDHSQRDYLIFGSGRRFAKECMLLNDNCFRNAKNIIGI